ncbi:MAG TPA: response regulator transcription factor [Terrimicrobiaceae bacterium]
MLAACSIAVIDDHPMLVEGLSAVLERNFGAPALARGCEASDIAQIASTYPLDALIVDLGMPGDVLSEISAAAKAMPRIKIIIFTASTDPELARKCLDAGASAYVLKGTSSDDLVDAIIATMKGQIFVSPSFSSDVIGRFKEHAEAVRGTRELNLSVREGQILRLLLLGKNNQDIGRVLCLSEKTIKGYMMHLKFKFNVKTRLELVLAVQKIDPSAFEELDIPERSQ